MFYDFHLKKKQPNNKRIIHIFHTFIFKNELARRKREWEDKTLTERQEQKDLREHEAEVVE